MLVPDDKWIGLHQIWFKYSGTPATYLSMGPRTPAVQQYLDSLNITVEEPTMLSRGGNLWDRPRLTRKIYCAMNRWHQNVVLPNGDVLLCCMIYDLSVKLGNLFTQPYSEIYEAAESVKKMAESGSAPDICRKCEWAGTLE